jgi:Flp pilus assembly protein TadD
LLRAREERASASQSRGLEQHPDDPSLLFDLGCADALAGQLDDALAHVARALELNPEWKEHAGNDPDLEEVRKLPECPLRWPAAAELSAASRFEPPSSGNLDVCIGWHRLALSVC